VPQLGRRLAEASRLGFRRAVVPAANPGADHAGIAVTPVSSVADALATLAGTVHGAARRRERARAGERLAEAATTAVGDQ
jgi:hypothetical protein